MIHQKEFESLGKLNEFVEQNKVKIINVETYKYEYDTGLPLLPSGNSFITTREGKRLFYTE